MSTDMYGYNDDDNQSEEGEGGGGQLLYGNYDEKTSAASFQQALTRWRQGDDKKKSRKKNQLKKKKSTHEAAVDTVHDSNGKLNQIPMPNIEFHSTNLTYGEKLLLKKYRRANKNHEDFFTQRTPSTSTTSRETPKKTGSIPVNRSLPGNVTLKNQTIEVEVRLNIFFKIRHCLLFRLSMMICHQHEQKKGNASSNRV
jgi:hypothetical protein